MNQFFQITIDGQASPLLHNGLTDLAGNQLLGVQRKSGTPLVVTFGVGTNLAYTDNGSNRVSLQLTKGGLMEMFLSPWAWSSSSSSSGRSREEHFEAARYGGDRGERDGRSCPRSAARPEFASDSSLRRFISVPAPPVDAMIAANSAVTVVPKAELALASRLRIRRRRTSAVFG